MINTIAALQQQLDLHADPKTKAWWEGYLKHVIPFRGVKMADIRAVLHQWVRDEGIVTAGRGAEGAGARADPA